MHREPEPALPTEALAANSTTRQSDSLPTRPIFDYTEQCLTYQEQAWSAQNFCRVEDVIKQHPLPGISTSSETLLALICNEVYLREEQGESPQLIDYQTRFPQIADQLRLQWEIDGLLSFEDSTADSSEPLQAIDTSGTQIDRYEILSELGRGGMGVVFRAWDPQLRREIALKRLLHGVYATEEDIARSCAEATAIGQIQHPAIVQVFDVGEHNGAPFLAMEFCRGGTLAKRLDGKPIAPRIATELIVKVCSGVAAAHAQRIVHRDLKPKNILLVNEDDWTPKISDFGLAKHLDNDGGATATGNVLGTLAYMPPEQTLGGKNVDYTADIYSVGAVLYECLTGRPPFVGVSPVDILDQVRTREPIPVRQLEPHVPVDLETIAHKCLRKESRYRYATAEELQADLVRFLSGQAILARREHWYQSVARVVRQYPLVTSLASVTTILLITVTIVSLAFAKSMLEANNRIRKTEIESKLEQARSLVIKASSIRARHQPGHRFEALSAIRDAAKIGHQLNQPLEWYDDLRDEAIGALVLSDAHIAQFRTEVGKLKSSDFTDDHRLVALSFEDGPISIRQLVDHSEICTLPRPSPSTIVSFVNNNELLMLGEDTSLLELWNVATASPAQIWNRPSVMKRFKLSCNRSHLIVEDGKVAEVIRTSDGTTLAQFSPKPYTREPLYALHPTHPYLVIHSQFEPGIELRDWTSGETFFRYRFADSTFAGSAWSSDGRRLAIATNDDAALLWFQFDPDTKSVELIREQKPSPHKSAGGPYINFNATGDRLLVYGWNRCLGSVDAHLGWPLFSSQAFTPTVPNMPRIDPQESIAGLFRSTDEPYRIGMMSIAQGRERTTLVPEDENGGPLSVSDPSGRILAWGRHGKLSILDVSSKRILLSQTWPGLEIYSLWLDDHYLTVRAPEICLRFPYSLSTKSPTELTLGIPERIHIPGGTTNIATDHTGQTVVACNPSGCWVKSEHEPAARRIDNLPYGDHCALSADGQLICFTIGFDHHIYSQKNSEVSKIRSLVSQVGRPGFSLDGRLMLDSYRSVLRTDNWQNIPRRNEGDLWAISGDGKQVASYNSQLVTSLSKTESGDVFARIDGHQPVFLPDGSKLVIRFNDRHSLMDLKLIRQGVLDLGIPWHGPDYADCVEPPPIERINVASELAEVTDAAGLCRLMDQRCEDSAKTQPADGNLAFASAMVAISRCDWAEALERLNRSVERLPNAITPRQWRAHVLAELRQFSQAVEDADWVLSRIDDHRFRLLRAEWLYRQGDFLKSVEECDRLINNPSDFVIFAHGLRHFNSVALQRVEQAIADRAYFDKHTSNDITTLNDAADALVGSDLSLRQPILARLYGKKLMSLEPDLSENENVRDTMGLICYRNDDYAQALEMCSSNLKSTSAEIAARAASIVAMSAVKLGDAESARCHLALIDSLPENSEMPLRSSLELKLLIEEAKQCFGNTP